METISGINSDNELLHKHIGCFYYDKNDIYSNIISLIKKINLEKCKITIFQSKLDKKNIYAILKRNKLNPKQLENSDILRIHKISSTLRKKDIIPVIKKESTNPKINYIYIIDHPCKSPQFTIEKLLEFEEEHNNNIESLVFTLFCLFDLGKLESENILNAFACHPVVFFNNQLLENTYYNKHFILLNKNHNKIFDYYISILIKQYQLRKEISGNENQIINLINLLPNIFIRIGHNGNIKFTNSHFEDISGYSNNAVRNKNFFNFFLKKNSAQTLKKNILENNLVNYEINLKSKNNEIKNILINTNKSENEIIIIGTNITRRRLIEEKLFDLSKRFQIIFEILPVGLALVNDEGIIFQINEKLKELTGYNEFDLIGEKYYNSLYSKEILSLQKTSLRKKVIDYISLNRKNGEIHLIRTCQKISLNKKNWLLISLTDITSIKQAEEEKNYSFKIDELLNKITIQLINSKSLKKDIEKTLGILGNELKLSCIGIYQIYKIDDKKYIKETHEWYKTKNLSTISSFQKLNTKSFSFFITTKQSKNPNRIINNLSELPDNAVNERIFLEKYNIKSAVVCPLIYNDEPYGFITFCIANKSHKWKNTQVNYLTLFTEILMSVLSKSKIKHKLTNTENNLNFILDNLEDTVFYLLSPQGKIIKWNKGAEKFYGYSTEEILYRNFSFITNDDALAEKKLDIAKNSNKCHSSKPEKRLKKNGSIILVEESIISFKKNNNIISYAVINKNVTNSTLFINEIVDIQRMDTISQMSFNLTHNFNNIFTTMGGYMELILQDINQEDPIYNNIEKLYKSLNQAIQLNKQLMDKNNEDISQTIPLNINNVINGLMPVLKEILHEKGKLVIDLDNNISSIKANYTQIEQILINLVKNSKDWIDEDGLVIIETEKKKLETAIYSHISDIPAGEYVILRITDNGKGISEDIERKIFKSFFSTKEKNKGLGLTIIENIVKRNSGYINLKKNENKGTIFEIFFPINTTGTVSVPKIEKNTISTHNKFTNMSILLVEDDSEICELLETVLINTGAAVITVNNGNDAIKVLNEKKDIINFLITDVMIPNIKGDELYLKAKELIPDLQVLFTSGYSNSCLKLDKKIKDEISFLQKPFTVKKLLDTIEKTLKK